jgi:hypothetical protein
MDDIKQKKKEKKKKCIANYGWTNIVVYLLLYYHNVPPRAYADLDLLSLVVKSIHKKGYFIRRLNYYQFYSPGDASIARNILSFFL